MVHERIEDRDERKLRFQKQIASYELLIVNELGFVPLSKTGAELLFEMLSQRYQRGSTMLTSNLPFADELGFVPLSKTGAIRCFRIGLGEDLWGNWELRQQVLIVKRVLVHLANRADQLTICKELVPAKSPQRSDVCLFRHGLIGSRSAYPIYRFDASARRGKVSIRNRDRCRYRVCAAGIETPAHASHRPGRNGCLSYLSCIAPPTPTVYSGGRPWSSAGCRHARTCASDSGLSAAQTDALVLLPLMCVSFSDDFWTLCVDAFSQLPHPIYLGSLPSMHLGSYVFSFNALDSLFFSIGILLFLVLRAVRIARERARVGAELKAAQSMQQLLLARSSVPTPGFDVDSFYLPASEVGGDFFLVSPDRMTAP